jgi:methionyl-tRNA formyltransferase
MSRLSIVGAELLLETLTLFDEIEPIKQDHDKATYAPIMTREDGRIDWTLTATEISCRVRGFQPYPTTFTIFRGSRLTIWQTEAVGCSEASSEADCGTIISALGGEMIVRCGDHTSLKISEVQPEGKRRMSVRDFINGVRPAQGESLAQ